MILLNGLEFSPTSYPHCAHSLCPLRSSQRADPTHAGGASGALATHRCLQQNSSQARQALPKISALLTSLPKVSDIRWKGPGKGDQIRTKEMTFFFPNVTDSRAMLFYYLRAELQPSGCQITVLSQDTKLWKPCLNLFLEYHQGNMPILFTWLPI